MACTGVTPRPAPLIPQRGCVDTREDRADLESFAELGYGVQFRAHLRFFVRDDGDDPAAHDAQDFEKMIEDGR